MAVKLSTIFKMELSLFSAYYTHPEIPVCIFHQTVHIKINTKGDARACLKIHSRNLHAPLCGIFHPNSVAVARYGALIRAKYPTNCDVHLAESLFQTRSSKNGTVEQIKNQL